MSKQLKYKFDYIENCNMCGDSNQHHKIIGKRLNQTQGKSPKKKIGITVTICKCNTCGLIYSNPQPAPFDLQDHYGIPPENYWRPDSFVEDDAYAMHKIIRFKELRAFKEGMKFLDIGAGLGKTITLAAKSGFDAYGFEPSQSFYQSAVDKMGINPDKLKLASIEEVIYPENTFDFISFGAVLEHLYDPSQSINKAMKWLKPNGLIHIEVPSSDWLINKIINFAYRIKGTDYVANLSPMHNPFHLHEFALKSFIEHSKKNNYQIAFHEYFVCQTYLPKFLDIFIIPYMVRTKKGMQLSIWLTKK